jgi:hypothetical protein
MNQPFSPPYTPAPKVASLPRVVEELFEWLVPWVWSTPVVPT